MRPASGWLGVLVLSAASLSGCLGPLDTLGSETVVQDSAQLSKDGQPEDDRIEDKHPVVDPARVVTEKFDRCEVQLNKSGSVTALDIVPFDPDESALEGLYPTRAEAVSVAGASVGGELAPSMEVVNGAMKPFNDGLYAAVELEAEGGPSGKLALLAALVAKLVEALPGATAGERPGLEAAAIHLGTALELGGVTPALPADLLGQASATAAAFRTHALYARPIGFYTWTPALEQIFTQDRFLQSSDEAFAIDFKAAAAVAVMLEADPTLAESYQRHLGLASHLTNPFSSFPLTALFPYVDGLSSLDDAAALETHFRADNQALGACSEPLLAVLPASSSKDAAFFERLYCNTPRPAGVNSSTSSSRPSAMGPSSSLRTRIRGGTTISSTPSRRSWRPSEGRRATISS